MFLCKSEFMCSNAPFPYKLLQKKRDSNHPSLKWELICTFIYYSDSQIWKYETCYTWDMTYTKKKHLLTTHPVFGPQKTLWTMTSGAHKPKNTSLKWTLAPLAPGVLLRDPRWIKDQSCESRRKVTRNLSIRGSPFGRKQSCFTQVLVVFNQMILETNVKNTTVSQWDLWIICRLASTMLPSDKGRGFQVRFLKSQIQKQSREWINFFPCPFSPSTFPFAFFVIDLDIHHHHFCVMHGYSKATILFWIGSFAKWTWHF